MDGVTGSDLVVAAAGLETSVGGVGGGAALLGALVVLALIDSTSFGTLLIPVWLLTVPGRVRVGRVLVYLGTVTGFYLGVGLLIMAGADAFLDRFGDAFGTDTFLTGQLIVGGGLVALSFAMDSAKAKARAAERAAAGGGRVQRWRARAMGGGDAGGRSHGALVGLALTATVLEVATMLPYLAGIGLIASEGPPWPGSGALLLGYCLVMVAPALVLLVGRVVAAGALERPLHRLDAWLTKNAQSTTSWIVGIVGALLALNAVGELGLVGT